MATGEDPLSQSGEMDMDDDQASLEQSSGVIQFKLPVMRDSIRT